jgi:hypothetical protein
MKCILSILLSITLCACGQSVPSSTSSSVEGDKPTATLSFKGHCPAKPPGVNFLADFSLTNRRESPTWFIMTYYCGGTLANDGIFNVPTYKSPFTEDIHYGRTEDGFGEAIRVTLIGKFHAFILPPQATLNITGYRFSCFRYPCSGFLTVYEATSLRLDEQTYQQWRGFPVITTANIKIPLETKRDKETDEYARKRGMHYHNHPRLFPRHNQSTVRASIISTNDIPISGYVL